ncbi:apolipoprotein N-acyltransferase [Trebonia kvetii]|uniref:apolipoprotein N-acyltransferase n=1 Tax=Trebonia kvetii TaxID=2480626 RepID=UPI001651D13F|nr:apolipoprotein N-acyltransferase [Trebonia kvetii]
MRGKLLRPFRYPARRLAFLAGGVPAVLVFPGPSLWYLAWFALVPAMALFTGAGTTREAIARGWWFGAGYLIAILQWMTPEIGPGVVLIGGIFGCMYSPFAVAVSRLLRPAVTLPRLLAALAVVPATWLIPEWIRSYQGLGGPWGLYGASQWQHPAVLALAGVGGVWLVSVALLLANTGLTLILGAFRPDLLAPGAGTAARAPAGRRVALAAAGAATFAAAAISGPLAFALTPPFPAVRQVSVALVQPGIVHDPARRVDASETLTRQFTAGKALAKDHPGLIVWGESSVAYDLAVSPGLLAGIENLSRQAGAEILTSQDSTLPGPDGGQEKVAVLVSPSGIQGRYVKTRLVPFGEYIPFRQQLGWLTRVSKAASSNMIPGSGARMLTVTGQAVGAPLEVGVLICFESAFPDMSRVETAQGAQLIVYQSSTSTFQGTWGPDQHASLAAIRAAETGRPVVQAALTGDSAAFDARGRLLSWLGQDSRGVVTVTLALPAASARTFYDQAGDYVMWSGVATTAFAALVMLLRRRYFPVNSTGAPGGRTAEYEANTGDRRASASARRANRA